MCPASAMSFLRALICRPEVCLWNTPSYITILIKTPTVWNFNPLKVFREVMASWGLLGLDGWLCSLKTYHRFFCPALFSTWMMGMLRNKGKVFGFFLRKKRRLVPGALIPLQQLCLFPGTCDIWLWREYTSKNYAEKVKHGNKEKGIRSFVPYTLEWSMYLDWNASRYIVQTHFCSIVCPPCFTNTRNDTFKSTELCIRHLEKRQAQSRFYIRVCYCWYHRGCHHHHLTMRHFHTLNSH